MPSPKISSSSMRTSPRLMPIRNSMRRSIGTLVFRRAGQSTPSWRKSQARIGGMNNEWRNWNIEWRLAPSDPIRHPPFAIRLLQPLDQRHRRIRLSDETSRGSLSKIAHSPLANSQLGRLQLALRFSHFFFDPPRPARSDPRPASGAQAPNERNLDHPICLGPWLRVIKNARLTASI